MGLPIVNLMQLGPKAAVLCKIIRNDGHQDVQSHSIIQDIYQKPVYDLLLVNNTNL